MEEKVENDLKKRWEELKDNRQPVPVMLKNRLLQRMLRNYIVTQKQLFCHRNWPQKETQLEKGGSIYKGESHYKVESTMNAYKSSKCISVNIFFSTADILVTTACDTSNHTLFQ